MSTPTKNAPLVGSCISHYRILNLLGAGGMGTVYEAEDQVLGRHIALNLLPRELCSDRLALERFQREARAASALDHPNICTVYEISEWQGEHFIALELLEGERLKDRIGNRPLSRNCVLDYGIQIADALDAAHRKGVIHRDVTPTNIFVSRSGQAKLLDFGLAKVRSAEAAAGMTALPTQTTPTLAHRLRKGPLPPRPGVAVCHPDHRRARYSAPPRRDPSGFETRQHHADERRARSCWISDWPRFGLQKPPRE